MTDLRDLVRSGEAGFQRWDERRERLLRESRSLVRASGQRILALHRGRVRPEPSLDRRARALLSHLRAAREFSASGFVQQALGEYAEAVLLEHAITGRAATLAALRGVPVDSLLLGVADAVGELRRAVLERLIQNDLQEAGRLFDQMETLFDLLRDASPPEALVGLRPKRDAARAIIERTRGELVNAKKSKELENKIDDVRSLLDEAEGRVQRPKRRTNDEDLDLDGAWGKK